MEVTEHLMNLLGQKLCKACLLLDGKNGGLLKLGIIGRTKVRAGADNDGKHHIKHSEMNISSLSIQVKQVNFGFIDLYSNFIKASYQDFVFIGYLIASRHLVCLSFICTDFNSKC